MTCAWDSFLRILPHWLRNDVDTMGKAALLELRLRLNQYPTLKFKDKQINLRRKISAEDMCFCINAASKYSPWVAKTAESGFLTASGGHRIGICGDASGLAGSLTDLTGISSLCLRIARDFPGIADPICTFEGSLLIIGKPGCGKTTLLRDLIRQRSERMNECVCVVDERFEIFPKIGKEFCFKIGSNTDVLSGCKKNRGIEMLIRSMNPDTIAIDEITAAEDCDALLHSGWCGINLLATAHAGSKSDLMQRPIYRPIIDSHLFETLIVMNNDMSFHIERLYT